MSFALYDPLDAESLSDPSKTYQRLRDTSPAVWHEGLKAWVVTDYLLAQQVVKNHNVFVADWRRVGVTIPEPLLSIQSLDPPDHTEMRRHVLDCLPSAKGDTQEVRAMEFAADRLDRVRGREFDVVSEVVRPVALDLASCLLGVTIDDGPAFSTASDAIVDSMDGGLKPESGDDGPNARSSVNAYITSWSRHAAQDSFVLRMLQPAGQLPEAWLLNSVRTVLQAAYQSWGRFMGLALLNLISAGMPVRGMNDDQLVRAVNELLRFSSSVQADARAAVTTTELGQSTIERGDEIIILHGAIDRDPAVFTDSDEMILDRKHNPHMAFGRGVHSCPGSTFVMQWTRGVIKAFLAYPEVGLAGTPRWLDNASIKGLAELRVAPLNA